MKTILTILITLISVVGYAQKVDVYDHNRKYIKTVDEPKLEKYLNSLPGETYFIQREINGKRVECRIEKLTL